MFTSAFPMITVPNLPAIVKFYCDLLAFRPSYRFPAEGEPAFVTLKLGTSEIGFGVGEVSGPAAGYALCVYADDCDRAVEELRAAGTPIVEEPTDMPWGERMARVTDPAGNEIVLVSELQNS